MRRPQNPYVANSTYHNVSAGWDPTEPVEDFKRRCQAAKRQRVISQRENDDYVAAQWENFHLNQVSHSLRDAFPKTKSVDFNEVSRAIKGAFHGTQA